MWENKVSVALRNDRSPEYIVYKKTDAWYLKWESDNEWFNKRKLVTKRDNEWYNEWQQVTTGDYFG